MTRTRTLDAALAALATFVVLWPMTTLFTPNTWITSSLVMIIGVAGAGILVRQFSSRALPVIGGQLAAFVLLACWLFGRGHLFLGLLPGPDLILAFNNLLFEARITIANYAAPAPTNRGITLAIGLIAGFLTVVVDSLAVTRRSPALAGLPLLTVFLISASNSGSSLHPVYFVAAGVAWLVMVGRQGVASMRRWSTVTTVGGLKHRTDADGPMAFAGVGRVLGTAGLAAAVLLPMAIPHLPTRYLVDGLGRSVNSTGFSDGQVGLNTTLDLAQNLEDPSTDPVLEFTTNAPNPGPLRVGALTSYQREQWRPDRTTANLSESPQLSSSPGVDSAVPRERYTVTVRGSRLEAPQIATPYPVVSGDLDGAEWGLDDDTLVARVNQSVDDYEMDYLDLQPDRSALAQRTDDPANRFQFSRELEVDTRSQPAIQQALADNVTPGGNRLDTAMAIQEYLRSNEFSYSLQLEANQFDANGDELDPISNFLATKTGYCIQFASAMIMMARQAGIPARMAIGFLPGSLSSGTYTVRASDAHAWPELFFEGVGWLRFEPTPASRTGTAPAYTLPQAPDGDSTSTAAPTDTATSEPTRDAGANDPGAVAEEADPATGSSGVSGWLTIDRARAAGWVLLALGALALALLSVPLAARWRRRQHHAAGDDATRIELRWQDLIEHLRDLGLVLPTGSTPRQAGRHIVREAYLESESVHALQRVVLTVEQARYAPPGHALDDVDEDLSAVSRAVSRTRRRRDRLRATWRPGQGLTQWRDWWDRGREMVVGSSAVVRNRLVRT